MAFVLDPAEREAFKRCRRAWDLGSRNRRGLEPVRPRPANAASAASAASAVRDALAVWYFPGMWRWERGIVAPLAHERLGSLAGSPPVAKARQLLDDYMVWAPRQDGFTPVRVEAELRVSLEAAPAPGGEARGLATPQGEAVEYRDRLALVVVEEDGRWWIVDHRIGEGSFADPVDLDLDQRAAAACWAWGQAYLATPAVGVIHNELLLDPASGEHRFRRTKVAYDRARLERAMAQLAAEVLDMCDPDLVPYPNPNPRHCGTCEFRQPCLSATAGGDVEASITAGYRPRPSAEEEAAGQLGTTTWSMGRGAAPWGFGRR